VLRFDCLVSPKDPCVSTSNRSSFRSSLPRANKLCKLLVLLSFFGLAGSLCAQVSTATSLTVTNTSDDSITSVTSGTVVVLTASVTKSGGGNVTAGNVNFCDANATRCEDAHLFGSAQLTSNGKATLKFRPAPGSHSYVAKFVGTTSNAASSSSTEDLTVTGGPFATTTSISPSGSAGNYTLNATVTSTSGTLLSPTGTVSFVDTNNGNYVLGSGPLVPGASTVSYAAPVGSSGTSGNDPTFSVMADFNQDGIPDIAVIEVYPDNSLGTCVIDLYFGNADGTFTKQSPINLNGQTPAAIAAGDLNGDGYPDLVISIGSGLEVILNNGSGGFGSPFFYNLSYTDWTGIFAPQDPSVIAIADINHDGHQDVVFGFQDFDPQGTSNTNPIINGSYAGYLGVALGNGDGTLRFSGAPPFVSIYGTESAIPDGIALADLTGNGNLDMITTGGGYAICVLAGNGDGTFQNAVGSGNPGATCFNTQSTLADNVVAADFNGDGKLDLAASSARGNTVAVMIGNGDRTFQTGSSLTAGSDNEGLVTADLNGDGIPDLATADNGSNTVTVLLGNGDGTFQTGLPFPAGNEPFSIHAGDLIGSGIPSLAVVDESGNKVSILAGSVTTNASASATGISPVGPATSSDLVEASYDGDDYYSGSTSGTTSLSDLPVTTTLGLQSNMSTVAVGGQVTLTATLSPDSAQDYSTDGETVTFYKNGASFATGTLSGGVASIGPHLVNAGTDTITATYGGDAKFVTSSSSAVQIIVNQESTSLGLQVCALEGSVICPVRTSSYGTGIQVTATLSPYNVSGGPTSDNELITFYNNGTSIGTAALQDGVANLILDEPVAGSYSFTASYGGDTNLIASSTGSSSPLTVQQVTSGMSLSFLPNSTVPYGTQVTLTAQFLPNQAFADTVSGETVTFYNNGASVGTATFEGLTAILRLNDLAVGSYNFAVVYPGDQNFTSSNSSPVQLNVQKAQTTLQITASPSGVTNYGAPMVLKAHLSPYAEGGGNSTDGETITFLNNGTSIGSATLSGGTAQLTLPTAPTGSDFFSASYGGDASFASSNGVATAAVTVLKASTNLSMTASPSVVATNQPLTLTASLFPYNVTGGASTNGESVTFTYNDGTVVGMGTLNNGVATLVVSGLAAGNQTFSASYGGDGNFASALSSNHPMVVIDQATTLTLSTSPAGYAGLNQPITLTAMLSPYSISGYSSNNGSVAFYNGSNILGGGILNNGVASITLTEGLPAGEYTLTATFAAFGPFAASASAPVSLSVAVAENFVVNTNGDDSGSASKCTPQVSTNSNATDSACSLRDALLAAAAAPEGANIGFDQNVFTLPNYVSNPALNTIALTNGTLTVPSNTTLTGATWSNASHSYNLVTVSGGGSTSSNTFTVFTVTGTGAAINNLTITGGFPIWNNDNPFPGGGIVNSGVLTLTNSEVTGNGTLASGGGIYNTGTLTLIGSTIDNNQAAYNGPGSGGGIDNENHGTLTIVNSTIANNTSNGFPGGGIEMGSGTLTMTDSTVSGNTGDGGGINNGGGTVTLANSIVSGNFRAFYSDIVGAYTNKGGNIIGYVGDGLSPTEIDDPHKLNLASLSDYGGYTPTMLPAPGSQAICAGTIANSPDQWEPQSTQIDTDQRGFQNYTESYQPYGGPALCVDAGAVQTSYTSIQFSQSSYTASAGGAVIPAVIVAVTENGQNRGGVPITLSYSGPGNLSGNTSTTVEWAGATFPNLSVDTVGSGALSTTINITPCVTECSFVKFNASANLAVQPPVAISPSGESFTAYPGQGFSQSFSVSGGSGSYQLSNSGTVPPGLTLTPSGTSNGTSWSLSGTPTQTGTYNFTLTATDLSYNSLSNSQSYTITVAPSTTTTLVASPASSATYGQTVTLMATVSSPTATGTVTFFDGSNPLGPGAVSVSGGSPNIATLALNATTLGSPLATGGHSFTAQYSGDAGDAPSTSNTVAYSVIAPNYVVNTISDDNGAYACTVLASTTSNTTDGNNGGNPGLCTLRDALMTAGASGVGNIYFDTTVFAASNLTGNPTANTISVDTTDYDSLNMQSNTTIQGPTSGSGATLANLVTIDGGGLSSSSGSTMLVVFGAGNAVNNLNFNNGYASNGGSGGAITNFGTLAVSGSSFNGNQATGSGGAIFNINTLTIADSTFSTNSATGGNGGAIDNSSYSGCATATITNSTFYQNSAANGGGGIGGGINNDGGGCTLVVADSTIYGNSTDNSGLSGGGVSNASTLTLTNTIISANTNGGGASDDLFDGGIGGNFFNGTSVTSGDLIGFYNGAPQNGTNIGLAPLGGYGGPTQTMIPLPGSPAICAGSAGNLPSGVTVDQRGNPIENITYPGYNSGNPCVDSGAVQTNYAIGFTTQPPATALSGIALSPAPVVGLTESGAPFAANTGTVSMTDSAGLLGGTTAEGLSNGASIFSDLTISAATSNDMLTAGLPLNGAVTIITAATNGVTVTSSKQTLTFSPAAGAYSSPQQVSIVDSVPGATIYYTTDGTTPNTNSAVFNSGNPISVSVNTTIKALGVASGIKNSSVTSATYTLKVAEPTLSLKSGSYLTPQSVSVSDTTANATIWYTTDDSTPVPGEGTAVQFTGTPITVSQNTTVKAVAAVTGWTNSSTASANYSLKVATPTFSLKAGTYLTTQSVSISDADSNAVIWYTTDDSTPVPGEGTAVQFTGTPIAVSQNTTVKATAAVTGWTNSSTASANYSLKVATPTFSPKAGTYLTPQSISISDTAAGATIWYTTDDSTPVPGEGTAIEFTGSPIAVNQTTTIKAVAAVTGWANSSAASATYTLKVATPTFSPAMGTYSTPQSVTISDSNSSAVIWYTTDDSTPVPGEGTAVQYTGTPIAVSQSTTIKAVAAVSGWANSSAASAAYTLKVATPTFGIRSGTYSTPQSVSISDATPNAVIWFTTDTSTPVAGGGGTTQLYTGAISVSSTTTVKAVAAMTGWTNSSMASATYTIR
jgi:hypothetical protein